MKKLIKKKSYLGGQMTNKNYYEISLNFFRSRAALESLEYAKVSDHEHSKVSKAKKFQLLPNKVKINC